MNTDIRIACTWPAHPKTRKLVRRLGGDGAFALVGLWCFAAQYRPLGSLEGMTAEDIALAAGWEREPETLVSALLEVGFLEGAQGSHKLHGWEEHQPWAVHAEARSERARMAARARWGKNDDGDGAYECGEHASGMRSAQSSNAPSPSPSPIPSPLRSKEKRAKNKRALSIPTDFAVTDDMRAWAQKELPRVNVQRETERFIDHAKANGRTLVDWAAGWKNWIRKADEFGAGARATPSTASIRVQEADD